MISNNFKIILAQKDIGAVDASKETGIAQSTLTKFKSDKNDIRLSTLIKICDYLNCTLSELIEYVPD
ncbi:helix-turn-helix domain-containing protein [Lactococcus piscium]|uniref:helix-turn-helix domain-containing protein n=1 Tax=Pseudolactococcus carnosus TaxID=2749961 RepID=UPI001FBB7FF2|nr:helix-turn-helix domain-containing protein [Lactococcus carnosus]MCJ1995700.1 helix-turn-helix domain-containing protein [Lactococcus carnosus]